MDEHWVNCNIVEAEYCNLESAELKTLRHLTKTLAAVSSLTGGVGTCSSEHTNHRIRNSNPYIDPEPLNPCAVGNHRQD